MRFRVVRALALAWLLVGAPAQAGQRFWLNAKQQRVSHQRSLLTKVAKRALGAVVSITTTQAPSSEAVASSAAATPAEPQKGLGAGFIIHPDGYILTSQHVVENATEIRATLLRPGGKTEEYLARVVGADQQTDCALLKIDAPRKLPVLRLGSARQVDVADWVVVIGNPFGLGHSVTVGVVSYKGRQDVTPSGRNGYFNYLQTDASINPGSSGGPILDLNGDVVAIANAVNVAGQGIGFGIPIDMAKVVLPELKAHGELRPGWLGIAVEDASSGVLVSEVMDGGPAARAGLLVGDIIQGVNRSPVQRALALRWAVATSGPGNWVRLNILRGAQPLSMRVRLDEVPSPDPEGGPMEGAAPQPPPAARPAGDR
jgi:serine protease Do